MTSGISSKSYLYLKQKSSRIRSASRVALVLQGVEFHELLFTQFAFFANNDQRIIFPYNITSLFNIEVILGNKGNDLKRQNVLILKQLLPNSAIRNIWKGVRRICILISGIKGDIPYPRLLIINPWWNININVSFKHINNFY